MIQRSNANSQSEEGVPPPVLVMQLILQYVFISELLSQSEHARALGVFKLDSCEDSERNCPLRSSPKNYIPSKAFFLFAFAPPIRTLGWCTAAGIATPLSVWRVKVTLIFIFPPWHICSVKPGLHCRSICLCFLLGVFLLRVSVCVLCCLLFTWLTGF